MSRSLLAISLFLAVSLIAEIGKSQSASAVMQIKVEVISGASVEMDESSSYFLVGNKEDRISYGGFSLTLPDDVHIIATGLNQVEMKDSVTSWMMNSTIDRKTSGEGKIHLRFFTNSTSEGLKEHHYQGTQIATIEYL